MKCPKCHFENPDGHDFCGKCLTLLHPPEETSLSQTKTIQKPARELVGESSFAGKYKVIKELGRGGMGVVYKAEDTKLKRTVALKFLPQELTLNPEAKERFVREAQAAAALDHPHICTVYEVDEAEGKTFISMAYVEGQSLKEKIKQGPLQTEEALDLALQIAEGLEEAHSKGIVHRDIKSANIMMTERGQAKIMDFGLAKLTGVTRVTKTGTTMGTLSYMSPEQARGETIDLRSDIFSFGVVLYELITAQLPFPGENDASVLHSLLYEKPEPLTKHTQDMPEEWQWIIDKALSKDIDTRYQSTDELLSDLKSLQAATVTGEVARPIRRIRRKKISTITTLPGKYWRRANWVQRIVSSCVLAMLIVAAVIFWPSPEGLVPTAEAASLVALPAQVYGDAEDNYLTDAIPGILSTMLSEVEWLDTKVPPSSIEVEQVKNDLVKIGEVYGVKMCVLSSVKAESINLVLNIQLVEPESKNVLWGKMYRGTRKNYIDLTREAAKGILLALRPGVPPVVSEVGLATSSETELAFQRGQYHSNRFNNLGQPKDFDNAMAAFKLALELEPDLADAAAEIAMLFQFKTEKGFPPQDAMPEIDGWARKALKINQNCSRAWTALVANETHQLIPDWRKLLEYGLKASSFDMEDSMAHLTLSFGLGYSGSLSLALEACLEARRLDPLYLYAAQHASEDHYILGQNKEALIIADEILRIEPDMPMGLFNKSFILINMNRLQEAADLLKRLEKSVVEQRFPREFLSLAQLVYNFNDEEAGLVKMALDGLQQIINDPRIPNTTLRYIAAYVGPNLVATKKTDPLLHLLNRYTEAGNVVAYDIFLFHPNGQSFLRDPRFEDILTSSKGQFEELLKILEDARSRGELPEYLEKPLEDLLGKVGIGSDLNQ